MVADPFQQLNARDARHLLIGQDDIDGLLGKKSLGGLGTFCRVHLEITGQESRKGGKQIRLVVDQQ